jgi:hypothetical protein
LFIIRYSLIFSCKYFNMKKAAFALLLFANCYAWSQKCSDYYYLQNNKTIEMTIKNKKGNQTGKVIYVISNLSNKGNSTTATVNSEMFDKNGKSISKASNNVECENGTLSMDMKMLIPSAQQEQMGTMAATGTVSYIDYPGNMKESDALKDASFAADFTSASGLKGNISMNMTNRKVVGKETVTTPAGSWECFKITYHSKMIFKMGIGIPMNADVTEWYAPGFGVVKTESGGGTTEITSIK